MVAGTLPKARFSGAAAGFFESDAFTRCLERGGKLAERFDKAGPIRGVTRDAYVTGLALWALSALEETGAEALVMAESPHSAAAYVLFEAAEWLGLPVLCFSAWGVGPVLSLRRGLTGPFLPAPPMPASVADRLGAALEGFIAGFSGGATAMVEPGYMTMQRRKERFYRWRDRVLAPLRQLRRWASGHFGQRSDSLFFDDALPRSDLRRRGAAAEFWRRRLLASLQGAVTRDLPARHAYVPLHFEPERTTLPDGGSFHNQLKMLAVLRGLLPPEVALVVKEHPSQFRARMIGHLGRSAGFYRAAQGIEGLVFAGMDVPSSQLIDGAELVASITGTAALEAAMLGHRALIFGDAWFEGAPGVTRYRAGMALDDMADGGDVAGWLRGRLAEVGLPGCVNPSNERYYAAFYADPEFAAAERAALGGILARELGKSE